MSDHPIPINIRKGEHDLRCAEIAPNFAMNEVNEIVSIEPKRNIIRIEYIPTLNEEGKRILKRIVTIECLDEAMLPLLREEARRVLE